MTKSHVGMGYQVCPICYTKHSEVVLLDRRLRDSLERDNFVGFELCKEHADLQEDYVGIVEIENQGNQVTRLSPKSVKPTGRYAMVRREAASHIFNVELGTMTYIDVEGFEKLLALSGQTLD